MSDTPDPPDGRAVPPVADAAGDVAVAPVDDHPGPVADPAGEVPVDEDDELTGGGLSPGARAFFDWVVVVGVALLVAILVRTFLLAHFVVDGQSMYSTLEPSDRVFVNKLSYRLHDPNRGDVVVLHEITGANERDLIKRVIALPGEQIEMENCTVWIDIDPSDDVPAQRLDEPYLDPTVVTPGNCGNNILPTVVPAEHVFVLGDNRPGSHDSRALGSISYDNLVGRAFVVFWPRSNWQWL